MKNKLLNFSKNLIISIVLVVIVMMLFWTTSSCAVSEDTLGQVMRSTIGGWYKIIVRISLSLYTIGYIIILIKLLSNRTPDSIKTIKESLFRFFAMFAVIYLLHYIMIFIIELNNQALNTAKAVGTSFSEIDMENDEYDLYETALSKAYEISAVPGFIGLAMYLLLVFYTYKFVIIYAKRYINIIVLILLAPIIFAISTVKRIVIGINDGRIGRWFKEFIFNVVIQTFHAIFYALLIGLALKISDDGENVIGVLIALIFFGFIFKIDAFIRKIFNFVGGSTKINTNKTVGKIINTTGNVVNAGLGALSGGIDSVGDKVSSSLGNATNSIQEKGFGEAVKDGWSNTQIKFKDNWNASVIGKTTANIQENGFKQALKDDLAETGSDLKNVAGKAKGKLDDVVFQTKVKAIETGRDAISKTAVAYQSVKAEAKDFKNIMNGERVRQNLTADEIVEQQHIMEEAEGLEGVRQNIQLAGKSFAKKVNKIKNIGSFSSIKLSNLYEKANSRVKLGMQEAVKELENDIERLDNNIEMVKRLKKVVDNLNKKKKFVRTADGKNLDVSNTMMLVVDTSYSPKEIIDELKEKYGDGIDVSAFVFEKVGAQTFLAPAVGSPRMGMAVLAESKYEEVAEHKIEELTTGKKHPKRTIRVSSNLASRIAINLTSRKEIKEASKTLEKSEKINKVGLINKTYKFSRFNPDTARKITNKMLAKNVESHRYLIVLNKVYSDGDIENIYARGRITNKAIEINRTIKATRKNYAKSIREIKLSSQATVANYKELVRQTRKIELANNVAYQIMETANKIKLGFKQIDQMTPGQVGLRKMLQEGKARQLSNGLYVIRQNATIEDKIKATGLVKTKDEENKSIIQFVVTKEGKIVPQIVTVDGKIVTPALDENGELQIYNIITQLAQNSNLENVKKEETPEEQQFRELITSIFTEYLEQQTPNFIEQFNIEKKEGETEEQAVFRFFVQEVVLQYKNEVQLGKRQEIQLNEGETEEQAILRMFVAETIIKFNKDIELGQQPEIVQMENETIEHFEMRKIVFEAYNKYIQTVETVNKKESVEQENQFVTFISEYMQNSIITENKTIQVQANETKEQVAFKGLMNEVVLQYKNEVKLGERPALTINEGETEEQAILRMFVTETIAQFNKDIEVGKQPEIVQMENETIEHFEMRQLIVQAYVQNISKVQEPQIERQIQFASFINQYIKETNFIEKTNIKVQENDNPEQVVFKELMSEIIVQYNKGIELGQQPVVQIRDGETQEQAIIRQFITETIAEYNEEIKLGQQPEIVQMENETIEHFEMRKIIIEAYTNYQVSIEQNIKDANNVQTSIADIKNVFNTEKPQINEFVQFVYQYMQEPKVAVPKTVQEIQVIAQEQVVEHLMEQVLEQSKAPSLLTQITQYKDDEEKISIIDLINIVQEQTQFLNETKEITNKKDKKIKQVVQNQQDIITEPIVEHTNQTTQEITVEPILEVQVQEGETKEQAIIRTYLENVIQEFGEIIEKGEIPEVEKKENETEEQFGLRKLIVNEFVQSFTSVLNENTANSNVENKDIADISYTIVQSATNQNSEIKQTEFVRPQISKLISQIGVVKTTEEEKVAFVDEIVEAFTEYVQPQEIFGNTQTANVQVEENQKIQQPRQTAVEKNIKSNKKQKSNKTEIVQEQATTSENISQEEFIENISQVIAEYVRQEEPVKTPITSSEEGVKQLDKVIQHIVTPRGEIVEQVVNLEDNTIDANSYTIVDKGGDMLVGQLQTVLTNENNVITNKDLGLDNNATVEDKVAKFQSLLEDVQREEIMNPLLTQIVEERTPEEIEMDELLVGGMQEAGIETVKELKQLRFEPNLGEEETQKKEIFEKFITEKMVNTGVLTPVEAEDNDKLDDAFEVLNERVENLSATSGDVLFETAAEMEKTRIVEELINKGEFTINNPPEEKDIDARVDDLSDLLVNLAKEKIDDIIEYPVGVIEETVDAAKEVYENAKQGVKTEEEVQFDNEIEKAEKKWAKKHNKEADKIMAEKIERQEKGLEAEVVKISLEFRGGVENGVQTVTLSNRYSIKDFYDKANKLDSADLEKTQKYFLNEYGSKLMQMQLLPFSFANNPVPDMDGWSIYVVTKNEDITDGDKEKEPEVEDEVVKVKEVIDEPTRNLIDIYYKRGLKDLFEKLIKEYEISSFDELYKGSNGMHKKELIRRIMMFLYQNHEVDFNDLRMATKITENLYRDVRFKTSLVEINKERIEKKKQEFKEQVAKDTAKKAVKNPRTKITTEEKAEEIFETAWTEEEIKSFKENEKENFAKQALNDAKQEMVVDQVYVPTSEDINDLLKQIQDSKMTINISNKDSDDKVLYFDMNEEEMMP